MDSDAEHYLAHKDDEADWEEAPAPRRRSERRRLDSMVSVRFSPEEVERVRAAAEAAGLSLSRYIRELALGMALGRAASTSIHVEGGVEAGNVGRDTSSTEVTTPHVRLETQTVAVTGAAA
jgi:predicted DNA binding CopG/RHH family protein